MRTRRRILDISEFFCVGWAGLRNGARDGAEFALHMDLEQGR
jgi:hypothetical protein